MSKMQKISYLSQLRSSRTDWSIQLKVIHTWKQTNTAFGETLEIIFADKKGDKIVATCKHSYMKSLGSKCVVGEWKNITNFAVTDAKGHYRPTKHAKKITFINFTKISECDYHNKDMYLSLMEFETVLSGKANSDFLIDVIGQALDVGELQIIQRQNGASLKKIEFTLRNLNDERLACCLWGKFAEMMEPYGEESQMGVVVCMIRFAKIGSFKGILQISSAYDTSEVVINPAIQEAYDLKEAFKFEDSSLSIVESNHDDHQLAKADNKMKVDKWNEYEDKTIVEMLKSTQIEKCKIVATIYAVDTDYGWYYWGCDVCNHRTFRDGATFWCEKCDRIVTNVSPKFKLHLMLKDDTGLAKFLILDTIANMIVREKATKILNGSLDEIEDPELLPTSVKDIIGKTFKFGVGIEKENIAYGVESYKVLKVWSMNNFLTGRDTSDTTSAKETTLTIGDVGSQMTEGEESSSLFNTPSSKRSQDERDDVPELTSTSKKVCLKTIKIETISEEEIKNDRSEEEI
ncbi:unnamed protein product [Eruca vesicaria subsp. sativa]|uniref:Replication factor A C-terminal domain-containing protein n=1 Tax=Eruca vesicaria subsp. sativa TaxID=29727 RepID=A0ABC8KQJ9_ERUVS|nr:unnamed protein product [Eruca vesicaria subsp. sativa]